jgi:hypothetical protein
MLFRPFYIDFVEGRVFAAWRRAFDSKKFQAKNETGYWKEFRSLYVDFIGRHITRIKNDAWRQMGKFTTPRWGKKDEFDKTGPKD